MKNDNDPLQQAGIYRYGTDELKAFEQRLIKYFSREYRQHSSDDQPEVPLGQGPLALAAEDLADNHYDEGINFFLNFLDRQTMSYTMAYYGDTPEAALSSDKTLEQAQTDKFSLIARRMQLSGDEKLLNFGCGFGYFESFLLETYPEIEIAGLTHSKDQYDFIKRRMQDQDDPLSSGRFQVFFGEIDDDCIELLGRERYDVVSSMGLVEQINNIEMFYRIIHQLLVPSGRMFHHLIVSRDLIPRFLEPDSTLIGEYFPGGKVLPFYALKDDIAGFRLEDAWFLNGMNYWRTLEKWHANFWENISHIYPEKMDSARVEYWNNYFVLCKAMFFPENGTAYGNGQYLYYKQS